PAPTTALPLPAALPIYGCTVEPAAATRPPGNRAKFLADFGQVCADIVVQFSRERAGTDPSGIGLGNTQHIIGHLRAHTDTGSRRDRKSTRLNSSHANTS